MTKQAVCIPDQSCYLHLAEFKAILTPLGFPRSSAGKESTCNAKDPDSIPGWGRYPREGISYPLQYSWASLVTQMVKNPPTMRDLGSVPELGRSPGGGQGNPLQYSCLENPQGQRSLVGNSPWGHTESDMTEQLSTEHIFEKFLMLHSAVHTLTKWRAVNTTRHLNT